MSNRRLCWVMPGSGLCSPFILWFHLSVGEGKQHEKQSSGTDAALCLKRGCLQTFMDQFSNVEKCLCVCVYIYTLYLCRPLFLALCTINLLVSWMFFHHLPSIRVTHLWNEHDSPYLQTHAEDCVARTVRALMHAICWMRIALKVQYNKREINLGNITSCQDFVPFSIFDVSILYLLFLLFSVLYSFSNQ